MRQAFARVAKLEGTARQQHTSHTCMPRRARDIVSGLCAREVYGSALPRESAFGGRPDLSATEVQLHVRACRPRIAMLTQGGGTERASPADQKS